MRADFYFILIWAESMLMICLVNIFKPPPDPNGIGCCLKTVNLLWLIHCLLLLALSVFSLFFVSFNVVQYVVPFLGFAIISQRRKKLVALLSILSRSCLAGNVLCLLFAVPRDSLWFMIVQAAMISYLDCDIFDYI